MDRQQAYSGWPAELLASGLATASDSRQSSLFRGDKMDSKTIGLALDARRLRSRKSARVYRYQGVKRGGGAANRGAPSLSRCETSAQRTQRRGSCDRQTSGETGIGGAMKLMSNPERFPNP